jgi:hypothetical protein
MAVFSALLMVQEALVFVRNVEIVRAGVGVGVGLRVVLAGGLVLAGVGRWWVLGVGVQAVRVLKSRLLGL